VGVRADDQVRDVDAQARDIDATLDEAVKLVEQHLEVNDNAVANHESDARGQDATWQQVKCVLLGSAGRGDDDRVAGVVPTVELHDKVDVLAEQVSGFALALVTPLGTDQHDRRHAELPLNGGITCRD